MIYFDFLRFRKHDCKELLLFKWRQFFKKNVCFPSEKGPLEELGDVKYSDQPRFNKKNPKSIIAKIFF